MTDVLQRHTLCLCNSTLCNEDNKSPAPALLPSSVTLTLAIAPIVFFMASFL